MSNSDIHSTHIHISEDFAVLLLSLIVLSFQGHLKIRLCGLLSELSMFCADTLFGVLLEFIQQILNSQRQLLKVGSLLCFIKPAA